VFETLLAAKKKMDYKRARTGAGKPVNIVGKWQR
jgi:hypothetical protein